MCHTIIVSYCYKEKIGNICDHEKNLSLEIPIFVRDIHESYPVDMIIIQDDPVAMIFLGINCYKINQIVIIIFKSKKPF